jgi:membrane protein
MNSRKTIQPRKRGGAKRLFERSVRFATHDVWLLEVGDLGRLRATLTRISRVLLIAGRGFFRDRCMQQAAALTYLTIFTLPALLALVFSMAKGFNAFERLKAGPIDAFLSRAFPADGGEGSTRIRELVDQIFAYVETADLKLLGTAGILFLLYATIKMLSSVEASFNEIWGVKRSRTLVRKLSDYLGIVIVAPIALLVGTAFTGFLSSYELRSIVGDFDFSPAIAAVVPLTAICLGMTLVLLSLPNTRVRFVPALLGGVVAGVGWQVAQFAFVEFQLGLTRVNAVFSSFAAVPLLLSWIYLSWVTLFVGAELSFALQNERAITSIARTGVVDQRFREAMGPRLAGRITAAFLAGDPPLAAADLAAELGVSPRAIGGVLGDLVRHRLLAETAEDQEEGYLPARDPDTITVLDVLLALRDEEDANPVPSRTRLDQRVDRILAGFEEVQRSSLHNHTLRELALSLGEEGVGSPAEGAGTGEAQARAAEHPAG